LKTNTKIFQRLSLSSYFHKIPEEVPELEKKAAHGLANPQEFSLPSPHTLWTKDLYDSFDVEKVPKEKVRNKILGPYCQTNK
jgi:hypothetical protein